MADAEEPTVSTPVLISLGFLVLAIVVPMLRGGFRHGSLAGAALAFAGAVPAAYAAWRGVQARTQSRLLVGMVLMLVCVGVGGLLIVLRAVHWLR